jgi:hypothetical protein
VQLVVEVAEVINGLKSTTSVNALAVG